MDGETQNVNEALNQLIWKKCPKDVYVGKQTLEIGVASAVISFNDGAVGLIKVLEDLSLPAGIFSQYGANNRDILRVKRMNNKEKESVKSRRKSLRAKRKGFDDKNKETEGEVYSKGGF